MSERLDAELEELHAYVDGQLSPEAKQRVLERLANDPEAQAEAEDYAEIAQGLRALFDPVLKEPVPVPMRRRPRQWQRPLGAIAASVLLLLAGGWVRMQLQIGAPHATTGAPHVIREAAMAYRVFAPEVRHPVEVYRDQQKHLVDWLSKRLGAQLRVPNLDDFGFLLVGGHSISSDDGAGALFMWEDAAGQRVVLYLCENDTPGSTPRSVLPPTRAFQFPTGSMARSRMRWRESSTATPCYDLPRRCTGKSLSDRHR